MIGCPIQYVGEGAIAMIKEKGLPFDIRVFSSVMDEAGIDEMTPVTPEYIPMLDKKKEDVVQKYLEMRMQAKS